MAKVITGKVRLSFVNLAEPKDDMQGNPFYSAQIIIDKNDQRTIGNVEKAIQSLRQDPKALAKVNNNAKAIVAPFRDGDTDTADSVANAPSVYEGKYFVNAKNKRKVTCLGKNKEVLSPVEIEDELYSGCYVQAQLSLYVYNANGNKGVGVGLEAVRKVAEGERLGGVTVKADDFDDDLVENEEDIY